ncbi:MAG: GAF domain-containing protein [Anaerolineae bacterium]|nr:GAF domain-containing protein [Anaerolineae bacterium]
MRDVEEKASFPAFDREAQLFEMSTAQLRVALDHVVLDGLRPVAVGLGILYLVMAYTHTYLDPAVARILVPVALLTALILGGLRFFLVRWDIPPRYAHLVGMAIAGLSLLNGLLLLALTREPLFTTYLMLVLMGGGFLLLSTPWVLVLIGMTFLGWGYVVGLAPDNSWKQYGLALFLAAVLSVVIHSVRLRTYRKLTRLHFNDQARRNELQHRTLQLETLITVNNSINTILDIDQLLHDVVTEIHQRFAYYYVGIFLVESGGDYVVARAGTGSVGRQLAEAGFRLRVGREGLIGWVAQHQQPLRVNNVALDSRYVKVEALSKTQAELVLPLKVNSNFLGVLDVHAERVDAFTEKDVQVLSALAEQIAAALHNAFLYQVEHSRRLLSERLYEVSRALSQTLDLHRVLNLILDSLAQLVSFDRGAVLLARDGILEMVAARGFPSGINPLQIQVSIKEDDVFQQIYQTQVPLMIPEILERKDWQQLDGLPQTRAWVGVPLINVEDKVIGMLSLAREVPVPYTENEVELAMTFAGQAAVALRNASLYSELALAYKQLERLDRTKSDFITVASHELRTPLSLIKGFSQLLREDLTVEVIPEYCQIVNGICNGVERLQEIVDRMVDIAEIDSRALRLHLINVSLKSLLSVIVDTFQAALRERHLTLTVASLETLPSIEADPEALQKVFSHLIVNAIKYTPDGGKIVISARQVAPGVYGMDDGGVEIVVRDTGIGIDPDYHNTIFLKFYQTGQIALHSSGATKFKGGGPGLGLAIVRGIVEAHRGQVWVESPGHDEVTCPGSAFHVVLPLSQKYMNELV